MPAQAVTATSNASAFDVRVGLGQHYPTIPRGLKATLIQL